MVTHNGGNKSLLQTILHKYYDGIGYWQMVKVSPNSSVFTYYCLDTPTKAVKLEHLTETTPMAIMDVAEGYDEEEIAITGTEQPKSIA